MRRVFSKRMWLGRELTLAVLFGLLGLNMQAGAAVAALGEGRAYEQVSPEVKAGYPVYQRHHLSALGEDGEAVKFTSVGAFAGSGEDFGLNPYLARRTPTGWVTTGLFPAPLSGGCVQGFEVFSPDLARFEFVTDPGTNAASCAKSPTNQVVVRQPNGSFLPVSLEMTTEGGAQNQTTVVGASANLSHVVFSRGDEPPSHVPLSGGALDETLVGGELFEAESSLLRLVAMDNSEQQLTRFCNVLLGGDHGGAFDAISEPDASEVFFSLSVGTRGSASCNGTGHPEQLFVRLGGAKTIEISRPLLEGGEGCEEVPCPQAANRAPATFQGASKDGSKVFFTTDAPLVAEDKDATNDLYMATIECPGGAASCEAKQRIVTSLVQVSHDPNAGQAAEVEPNVVAISPDGSHAYFVARGVLNSTPNGQGEAARDGAENLYIYSEEAGVSSVAFIADLCSGPERSGVVGDVNCADSLNELEGEGARNDKGLWQGTELREAQTTTDGGFLVFGTYAQLIRSGPEADADTAEDVYLYNAATGDLRRVSVGENGLSGNGNDSQFDARLTKPVFTGSPQSQHELGSRAISEDGSKVVFVSSEPLSTGAINGQQNVYLWSDGHLGMISSGTALQPDEEPVITPSGNDILFLSSAELVPGDTDGLSDLYDARVHGGFPQPAAPVEPCSGDACQGPLSAPAPALTSGSATEPPGDNLPPPPPPPKKAKAKSTVKAKPAKARKHKRAHKSGRGKLSRKESGR